ncbi:MAG: SMP-30/gluconolactonase/LRE family protein [Chloroflexi bacterium]|nr:SMP-30/gluconolactonase/LRE family protein [Chloroflexota bacterium]
MKWRVLALFVLSMCVFLLATWTVSAQGPKPPTTPVNGKAQPTPASLPLNYNSLMDATPSQDLDSPKSLLQPSMSIGNRGALRSPQAQGQPGFSLRYVQSFGIVEVPYIDDSAHINGAQGIGTDGSNVWIVECPGRRALKYTNTGNYLMQIGKAGFRDSVSGTALPCPYDAAVDGSGNVWIVDSAHHAIKFNSSGSRVSELGSTWNSGTANNRFNNPRGIAFDPAGNIYVSDTNNHRIQVFTSAGVYTATIGITASAGSSNGQFNNPIHITVDNNNLLYVADSNNQRVQIFNVTNLVAITYVATIGTTGVSGADNAHLNSPQGIAVDIAHNRLFVADAYNYRVQVFDYATRAYSMTLSGLSYVSDVAVDSTGNLYVSEQWFDQDQVQQFDSSLAFVRRYGTVGIPYLTDGLHYHRPSGLAIAPDSSIYVSEEEGRRLLKLNSAGVVQWIKGEGGVWGYDNNHFTYADGVALDSLGRVYVVDRATPRVQVYDSAGSYVATLGTGQGTGIYQFNYPYGVAIGQGDAIYVADTNNHRVQVYDSSRNYVMTIGTGIAGTGNNQFNNPRDIATDAAGNIYVADTNNHRIQVFNNSRVYVRTIGVSGVSGTDFGHLSYPVAVTVDASGRTYVGDSYGNRIMVFDNTGAFLTTIGNSGGNRTGQMRNVEGLAVDPAGNLYLADKENHRITKWAIGVPGWQQVNINGFGDRNNGTIYTLAPFNGQLYAGTYNGVTAGQIWRTTTGSDWSSTITAGFGLTQNVGIPALYTFNNQLYAGVRSDALGAAIYRSPTGNSSDWTQVLSGGLGDPTNAGVYRFIGFKNQLYAGSYTITNTHGTEVWRSPSGDTGTWTHVVLNGFGDPTNWMIRSAEVYNDYLYLGTGNSTAITSTGGAIFRSGTGNSGDWAKVTDGFGDPTNYIVSGLVSFNGYLYASTTRWDHSGDQVWRCQVCNGTDWQKVVDNGFGNPLNESVSFLQVFNGELYCVVGNFTTGLEVWRSRTGNLGEWSLVSAGGFGNSNNSQANYTSVIPFNNALYVGVVNGSNGGQIWQLLNQLYLPLILR